MAVATGEGPGKECRKGAEWPGVKHWPQGASELWGSGCPAGHLQAQGPLRRLYEQLEQRSPHAARRAPYLRVQTHHWTEQVPTVFYSEASWPETAKPGLRALLCQFAQRRLVGLWPRGDLFVSRTVLIPSPIYTAVP